jgi:hypothetical protein
VIFAEAGTIAGLPQSHRIRNLLPQSGPIIQFIWRQAASLFGGRHNFAHGQG